MYSHHFTIQSSTEPCWDIHEGTPVFDQVDLVSKLTHDTVDSGKCCRKSCWLF